MIWNCSSFFLCCNFFLISFVIWVFQGICPFDRFVCLSIYWHKLVCKNPYYPSYICRNSCNVFLFLILAIYISLFFSWPGRLEVYQFYWSRKTSVWFWFFPIFCFIDFCTYLCYFLSLVSFGCNLLFFFQFLRVKAYFIDFRPFCFSNIGT